MFFVFHKFFESWVGADKLAYRTKLICEAHEVVHDLNEIISPRERVIVEHIETAEMWVSIDCYLLIWAVFAFALHVPLSLAKVYQDNLVVVSDHDVV